MISVRYINREGGGYAETYEVEDSTKVEDFISQRGIAAADYIIRLKRGVDKFTPTPDEVLREGDRLSAVPLKVEGAA